MKCRFLPQEALKLLACLLMFVDHFAYAGYAGAYYTEFRIIGRLAFPIFCFLLSQGFLHTHSRKKYILRLAVGAVLAELPYNLLRTRHLFSIDHQSVMVTLLLAFIMAMLMEKIQEKPFRLLLLPVFFLIAHFLNTDYGGGGILIVSIFLLTEKLPYKHLVQTGLLLLAQFFISSRKLDFFGIMVPIQLFAVFAMVPIALYSGRKVTKSPVLQWAFYLFYPVHMLILVLFR